MKYLSLTEIVRLIELVINIISLCVRIVNLYTQTKK